MITTWVCRDQAPKREKTTERGAKTNQINTYGCMALLLWLRCTEWIGNVTETASREGTRDSSVVTCVPATLPPPSSHPPPPSFFLESKTAIKTSRKWGESGGKEKERRKGVCHFVNTKTCWFRTGSDAASLQEAGVDRRTQFSVSSEHCFHGYVYGEHAGDSLQSRCEPAAVRRCAYFCSCAGRLSSRKLTMDSKRK